MAAVVDSGGGGVVIIMIEREGCGRGPGTGDWRGGYRVTRSKKNDEP